MKVYLVGGAVRDQLLALPIHERDWVVVGAQPQQLLEQGYRQVGRGFPVFLHPETQEEYALARTEKKLGSGYHGFSCDANSAVTLEEDLARRDLTINAIAMDHEGNLIDPYHGQQDIHAKILRHVSDAFVEDPVRVLRVARFMARFQSLGFQIAPETKILMQRMVRSGELAHLVAERVWQEWQKSLQEKDPSAFIKTLRACGALKVILPEIDRLFGVPNTVLYHAEIDSGIHTLMALEVATQLTTDPVVRFATIMHDLGKACTPMAIWPKQPNHEQLGLPVIEQLCNRLAIPKRYQKLAMLAAEYHLYIHRVSSLSAKKLVEVLTQVNAFKDENLMEQLLMVCEADSRGRTGLSAEKASSYRQAQDWRVLLAECRKITAQTYIEQGHTGSAIQDALFAARVACVEKMRQNMSEFE
ncbi:MAG: multifunctional CCA addition/repair protein [Gammaproteobacteria bacterium]